MAARRNPGAGVRWGRTFTIGASLPSPAQLDRAAGSTLNRRAEVPADIRCGFDRLADLASRTTGRDRTSEYLFQFRSRGGDSRHAIDPQRYLTKLLVNLPVTPMSRLDEWLPDGWRRRDTPPPVCGVRFAERPRRKWRRRCGSELIRDVIAGVMFVDGKRIMSPEKAAA